MSVNSIIINDLKISFGDTVILQDFSLSLKRGQSMWIRGANGSGKSSLLKCLAGINSYSGEILIHGDAPNSQTARACTVYCPDDPALYYDLTLKQHATFTAMLASSKEIYDKIIELYIYFGISKYIDKTPSNMSKGTKQKISLCLSLGLEKDIMLLDEPFNGLDVDSVGKLFHIFNQRTKNGLSTIFTAHQESEVSENIKNIKTLTLTE